MTRNFDIVLRTAAGTRKTVTSPDLGGGLLATATAVRDELNTTSRAEWAIVDGHLSGDSMETASAPTT